MDRDTAIEKIKKCLALARSANENEAATALRQAQALMKLHDVDEWTLSLADVKEVPVRAASNAKPLWEVALAETCADAFGCEMYLRSSRELVPSGAFVHRIDYVFVGLHTAADLAGYAFTVLQRQCVAGRKKHIERQPRNCKQITKIARGDLYAQGWVLAVDRLVEKFAGTPAKEQLVLTYMESRHPDLDKFKPARRDKGRNVRGDHLLGSRDGSKAQLRQAVGGREKMEQLT